MALGYALGLRGTVLRSEVEHLLEDRLSLIDVHKKAEKVVKLPLKERIAVVETISQLGATFLQGNDANIHSVIGRQILDLCAEDPNSIASKDIANRMAFLTASPKVGEGIERYLAKHQQSIENQVKS